MKKILTFVLVLLLLVSMVSCGGNKDSENSDNTGTTPADTAADTQPTDTESDAAIVSDTAEPQGDTAEGAKLTGELDIIELDNRDPSILRGIRINGLSVGSAEDINDKEPSLTDVRCIFELNEWIEFYPDTDTEYSMRVWVLKHRDDTEYYENCQFSDLMPGFASYCDLHYPVDEEDPDNWYWGNFYLNSDDFEAGYYDFVFTYEGTAIGVLQTRFYNTGELSGKSGAELEGLMHE